MSLNFYHDLLESPDLPSAVEASRMRSLPPDWFVLKTDMISSTKSILQGKYKEVNSAAGLIVIAVANLVKGLKFPFIFGGDGVTICLHQSLQNQAIGIVAGVLQEIKSLFGFSFRLSVFPMEEIYWHNLTLKCGKIKVSEKYHQAILMGTAIDWMEQELKNDDSVFRIDLETVPKIRPNMNGFSCRWRDFPSPKDETLALIIRPRHDSLWSEIFNALRGCLHSESAAHPLRIHGQRMASSYRQLRTEAIVMAGKERGLRFWISLGIIHFQMFLVKIIAGLGIRIRAGKKNLEKIPFDNVDSSDTRKIENSLYTVVAATRTERACLERVLTKLQQDGKIFWGMHISNRAMLTCLVQMELGDEVHFVDAADGGYALASQMLKRQMQESS